MKQERSLNEKWPSPSGRASDLKHRVNHSLSRVICEEAYKTPQAFLSDE